MHWSIFNQANAGKSFQSPAQENHEAGDMKTCLLDCQQMIAARGLAPAVGDPSERALYHATLPVPSLRVVVPHDAVAPHGSSSPTHRSRANHI
jgi:hypothetical protein